MDVVSREDVENPLHRRRLDVKRLLGVGAGKWLTELSDEAIKAAI